MFGSDWPVCLTATSYKDVLKIITDYFSGFSEKDKKKIMGENAADFYKINKTN